MNFTKTKKVVATGLSALMMMTSTTSVFAAESCDKSANLNYQVSSSYDWIIHSAIDFGADAGVGKTVDRTGNQVKVLKNVIPEGKYLNISVKGSGVNDAFTVSNGGSEVLNYDVSDDNGAVGVNGNVLSVPAGTNTATQNMGFKLNTTKKSAEVAGQYNGRVIYNAEVGNKLTVDAGDVLDIEGFKCGVIGQDGKDTTVICLNDSTEKTFQYEYDWKTKLRPDGQNANTYEGSDADNYLENNWYNSLPEKVKSAIQVTTIKQASYTFSDRPASKQETGPNGQVYNTISRHVFLPSMEEAIKIAHTEKWGNYKFSIFTRDSVKEDAGTVAIWDINPGYCNMLDACSHAIGLHPVFKIDLSQVNHSVVK